MPVPYTFGAATSAIPLSQLDSNFATTITLGNTAIQLGNTVTTLNNMTLANVTISSGNVTITNVSVTTANVTTLNAATVIATTGNITTVNATTVVATTANATTANITTGNLTDLNLTNNPTFSGGTANGVLYLNGSKVATSGSALTFDGTNFKNTTGYVSASTDFRLAGASFSRVAVTDGGGGFVGGYNITYSGSPVYDSTGTIAGIYNSPAGNVVFYAGGSAAAGSAAPEGMRLTSTGLGIGTSSPGAKLHVVSSTNTPAQIQSSGTTSAYLQMTNTGGGGYISTNNNDIVFSTTGSATERMRLDSSGNLGIGTTPSAWSGVNAFQISRGSFFADTGSYGLQQNAYYAGGWKYMATAAALQYQAIPGTGFLWNIAPSGTAGAAISFTQAMTLDSSGNLGLGVTPSAWGSGYVAFQSKGTTLGSNSTNGTYYTQNAYFDGTNWVYVTTAAANRYQMLSGVHSWHYAPSGTAGNAITFTQAMTLDASGQLGIGSTSPSARLDVVTISSATYTIRATSTDGSTNARITTRPYLGTTGHFDFRKQSDDTLLSYLSVTNGATPNLNIYNALGYSIIFGTNNTERARIDSSGDLLIGRTTQLVGYSKSITLSNGTYACEFNPDRIYFDAPNYYVLDTAGPTGVKLASGATSWAAQSDERLKDIIEPIEDATNKVLSLRAVIGKYKSDKDGVRRSFLIAQDVQKVLPEVIDIGKQPETDDETEYLSIRYTEVIPLLVAAIKELKAEVDSLKSQLKGA